MPTPGSSTSDFPAAQPIRWPNPLKAWRKRRELEAFKADQRARQGSALDAIHHALDQVDDHYDRQQFLKDWIAGDLEDWPEFKPGPGRGPYLTLQGRLTRSAALLSGFMGALLFVGGFFDAMLSPTPSDPLKNLLTLAWAGSVVLCAVVAWRAALKRGEG